MRTGEAAAELAHRAAEAMRTLNHDEAAPQYPGDVYSVVGNLSVVVHLLPQTCRRLAAFLHQPQAAGQLRAVEGFPFAGDPAAAVQAAVHQLHQAAGLAFDLGNALLAISGLAAVEPAQQ